MEVLEIGCVAHPVIIHAPSAVVSGDLNGDKSADVVIANQGSHTIEILTKIC